MRVSNGMFSFATSLSELLSFTVAIDLWYIDGSHHVTMSTI